MGLENLKSIFQQDIKDKVNDYQSNQPLPGGNPESILKFAKGTHEVAQTPVILDTLLRQSPAFVSENLITKFYTEQNFDSRVPKNDGITIANINTYKGTRFTATNPTDYSSAGIGELPFVPTSQLGLDLSNQNWQNLYNADHTPITNPQFGNITPISYPNVNRDKLSIRGPWADAPGSLFSFSRTQGLGLGAGEPYIVSSILGGRLTNSGNRSFPIGRATSDTLRLTKYLSSPAGVEFIARQNFLGANSQVEYVNSNGQLVESKQRFKSTYNPVSTLTQTLGRVGTIPIALLDRTEPGLQSLFGTDEYGNTSAVGGNVPYNLHNTFYTFEGGSFGSLESLEGFANQLISNITGTPNTIKEKSSGGDFMTNMAFGRSITRDGMKKYLDKLDDAHPNDGEKIESPKNGMPFYFKDMRDGAFIFFRAYIEGLTENVSPSWTSHNYIGRSEPAYIYERGERELNFTLKLVAQTRKELDSIYIKMNKLTSLCYPQYKKEEPVQYSKLRMKPPLTKLRIGEHIGKKDNEQLGFIKSLSYTVDESSPWETELGARVPRHISVNISFQVIHQSLPKLESTFGFYGMTGGKI